MFFLSEGYCSRTPGYDSDIGSVKNSLWPCRLIV